MRIDWIIDDSNMIDIDFKSNIICYINILLIENFSKICLWEKINIPFSSFSIYHQFHRHKVVCQLRNKASVYNELYYLLELEINENYFFLKIMLHSIPFLMIWTLRHSDIFLSSTVFLQQIFIFLIFTKSFYTIITLHLSNNQNKYFTINF